MKSLQAQLEAGRLTSTVGAKDERGREIGSTNKLFEPYGGKMFGVLVGECAEGQRVVLRAFSGQLDGAWDVPGWCPPLFDVPRWRALEATYEPEIKEVTAALATASRPEERVRLQHLRAERSRALMERYHALYRFTNFADEQGTWSRVLERPMGIPSGMGDCCAPKLLSEAAQRGIHPLGMSEFYWGATNRTETRQHGRMYLPCAEKCAPILGFMLCGLH